ncbi:HBS1-like protein isoform X1 [Zingiber officinale]|nr:HBS1-like protein isoform X1 [Zingiber officinale]XP_042376097.1 HBS1-like protein isoform X1 [Zingiber officinale]
MCIQSVGTFCTNRTNSGGSMSKLEIASSEGGTWCCSICTYENSQRFIACELCGILRNSSVKFEIDDQAVNRTSMNSEVSLMGRSLFYQSSNRMPKESVICASFLNNKAGEPLEKGQLSALIDLQNIFLSPCCNQTKHIEAFRFDTPSPDDLVSSGKSTRAFDKVDSMLSTSLKNIRTATRKKGIVELLPDNQVPEILVASSLPNSHNDNVSGNPSSSRGGSPNSSREEKQKLANNLQILKLEYSTTSGHEKTNSVSDYKPEDWMLSDKGRTINQLNLAIVGHVDCGKSTLSGRLLQLLGKISKKEMHRYERESKEKGKSSSAYAWALDASVEERERGVTMTVAVAYFSTKRYRVVLLDSPGHKDFVPNMISGATQADAAVLVVDAAMGAFEAGMGGKITGQTKEHAQLIRSFGVEQIIVAVNKMDLVDFSKDRFDYVKLQLGHFLRTCGFKESCVTWIPLSSLDNQNLLTTASDIRLSSWYQGYCLLEAIDGLPPPQRDFSKPFLMPICDVIVKHSSAQVAACGKIETGAIRIGSKVIVMPSGNLATVKNIERDSSPCNVARAGDNVAVSLHGVDAGHVIQGGVLCHPDFPVNIASNLELKVLILDIETPIIVGSQVELHVLHSKQAAKVVKLQSLLDPKTGHVIKNTPRFLVARQS